MSSPNLKTISIGQLPTPEIDASLFGVLLSISSPTNVLLRVYKTSQPISKLNAKGPGLVCCSQGTTLMTTLAANRN